MLVKKASRWLKALDQHGTQIHLTYNGRNSHQSAFGGVVTLISRLGILAYFFVLVSNMINRDKTIQMSQIAKSPTKDIQEYPLDETKFDVGFTLQFMDNLPHLKEKLEYYRYFDVRITYQNTMYTNTSEGVLTRVVLPTVTLPFTNCTVNRFANLVDDIKLQGIDQPGWFCPTNISFTLKGQAQSLNSTRMRFSVGVCINSTANNNSCAPIEDIIALAGKAFIQIASLNTYFDENQFDSKPIKHSLNVEIYPMAYGYIQQYVRTLRKSVITAKDNWISSQFESKEDTFYQEFYLYNKFGYSQFGLLSIGWTCDGLEQQITRKVLSLTDAAATAGGFAGIILLFAKLFAKFYAEPLFCQSIFKELYTQEVPNQMKQKLYQDFKHGNDWLKLDVLKTLARQRQTIHINTLKYSFLQIFNRCTDKAKNCRNVHVYREAKKKLRHQLDIRNIVTTMSQVKSLENLLLTDYQKKILKYSAQREIKISQDVEDPPISKKESFQLLKQQKIKQIEENIDTFNRLINNQAKPLNKMLIKEIFGLQKKKIKIKQEKVQLKEKKVKTRVGSVTVNNQTRLKIDDFNSKEEDLENSQRILIIDESPVKIKNRKKMKKQLKRDIDIQSPVTFSNKQNALKSNINQ